MTSPNHLFPTGKSPFITIAEFDCVAAEIGCVCASQTVCSGVDMNERELFSTINANLKLMVAVHTTIFRVTFWKLSRVIDFKDCSTTLGRVTIALGKLEVLLQSEAGYWKQELGGQGLKLVLSYLSTLKEAAVKLTDVAHGLLLKTERRPYSYSKYQADLKDYERLEMAYSALGIDMNNLSRSMPVR